MTCGAIPMSRRTTTRTGPGSEWVMNSGQVGLGLPPRRMPAAPMRPRRRHVRIRIAVADGAGPKRRPQLLTTKNGAAAWIGRISAVACNRSGRGALAGCDFGRPGRITGCQLAVRTGSVRFRTGPGGGIAPPVHLVCAAAYGPGVLCSTSLRRWVTPSTAAGGYVTDGSEPAPVQSAPVLPISSCLPSAGRV